MVQIKTTRSGKQSESITLSSWQRMCKEPIPWFVPAVHLDENDRPCAAYLVHIGEAWCERVLRRLSELGPVACGHLHKHWMDVSWSEADRLPST
jgi:hypothetical protein